MGKKHHRNGTVPATEEVKNNDSDPKFLFLYGGNLAKMSMGKKAVIAILGETYRYSKEFVPNYYICILLWKLNRFNFLFYF